MGKIGVKQYADRKNGLKNPQHAGLTKIKQNYLLW